ncbi:hypothetical protein Cfor_02664 [Coptotermes formosanus]|uniref:RNA-binding protein 5 n=1 Tax=Coptotermes formosanus TaxID=36987 RepID=A0A6L2PHG1_COPFO|nr:hypothetical protein Cfor_02664 [Coptotermes formosanus]
MNPDADESYHMADTFSDRQADRDWTRRSNRDRDSKLDRYRDDYRYKDEDRYPEDDEERDRYGYDSGKGRYQRYDHKRHPDTDKRGGREDSDRRGQGSQNSRTRDVRDGREMSKSREIKASRDAVREGRDVRSRPSESGRERDYGDSRESRSGKESKSFKPQGGRDSKSHDRDKDWDKKESRWNEHDDDSADSLEPPSDVSRISRNAPGDADGDNYKYEVPNNTIMIRGLAQHITENDIRQDILSCELMPKDIRLIRKKDTGASRGFAFVEFNTLQEASQWMEMKQGILMLQDQYRAIMHFSIPKETQIERNALKSSQDWICIKCAAHNFKRRDVCFKCHSSRQESEGGEGSAEVSMQPTPTVLLRGLDVLSTEDSVLQAIKSISSVPIRSIRIGQDPLTNTSRGVCYLEMNHVMDAVYMHNALVANSPVVDGKKGNTATSGRLDADSIAQRSGSGNLTQYTLEDIPRLADYSASLYATSPAEYAAYQQYYQQYYRTQISQASFGSAITLPSQSQADCVNAAAAVAQSAIQQVQAAKEIKKQVGVRVVFVFAYVPDVSTYQYDETSGYYYDPQTGLYYDASSQYYYNPQSQQFLYWDAEKLTYLPAPVSSEDANAGKDEGKKVKEKDRQDKVKVAKKIAKDMERWAKTLNQKKDSARQNLALVSNVLPSSKSIGAADAGYAVLERKERPTMDFQDSSAGAGGLVAAYGGGSESDDDIEDVIQEDRQHTNWAKLACLLCKRQFPTKESLIRHQQLSDLHKLNLESWYHVRGLDPNDPQQRNKKYRDRAKERRQKFGEPEPPHPNHLKEKYLKTREDVASISYEEPTKSGIGSDNVGNKLLQKMGWQEGMGLGKSNQGRTSIIQTEHRASTAGLGAKGGTYGALPGETYKDCVKKMMFARYQELTEQEHDT